ncbi:hypothetical protein TNCV_1939441 [Trichonephila clavipes]|nr:hypothetical protein TNCV_1939441 [Trichonephila clavipes]
MQMGVGHFIPWSKLIENRVITKQLKKAIGTQGTPSVKDYWEGWNNGMLGHKRRKNKVYQECRGVRDDTKVRGCNEN